MHSADPRERDDLCGQELAIELPGEGLAEEYDPKSWYEAGEGVHYCSRAVWDKADDGGCIWHADVANKSVDALAAARSEKPARLDRAVLRESDLWDGVSFSECQLIGADLVGANLFDADLGGADLRDADLSGADLGGADLSGAVLRHADLSGADLRRADLGGANLFDVDLGGADLDASDLGDADFREADLGGADLGGADLGGADLREADLGGADLRNADLSRADLRDTDLNDADLQNADLGRADLRNADLTACKLGQTTFEDTTFDEATVFGARSGHEIEADAAAAAESRLATRVSSRFRALDRPSTDPEPLERAETQYRTIQRLRREHDLKQDPALEIQEKHARRKRALAERRYWDWFKLAIYRWPMGYGEKPWHVVGTSLAVILVSALLYPLAGIRVDGDERTYPAVLADPAGTAVETVRVVAEGVYFSTVTFTTLGYGDVEPVGWAKALSTVESFLGALLMALLVFVLGRRATW